MVLDAVEEFNIDLTQLHNDSTSIKLAGSYADADGHTRGGKTTVKAARGHSKDHRPDLKQLVRILTITADGAVPIAYRLADRNTEDSMTHIATWDHLVAMLGRSDWLYVADCKLATRANMDHIDRAGGRFCSILPATRAEDRALRDWVVDHDPDWVHAHTRPARRQDDPDDVYCTIEAPWPSAEGYRIVWVASTGKATRDAESRRDRIGRAIAALDDLNQRLASPKTRMKTTAAVEAAATTALDKAGATRWISYAVTETTEETFRQEKRGRPGANTRYRKHTRTHHRINWGVDEGRVGADACSDGMFPLIANDQQMTGGELLAAYKYQPNLEKRHAQLKGTQLVAPVFLHDPARIEGLLCCHFIAMLLQALIERSIRNAMADHGRPWPLRALALPRRPRLLSPHRRPRPGDLYRTGPSPPPRRREKHRADLPAQADPPATTSPRPTPDPHRRLPQRLTAALSKWGPKSRLRCAESKLCPSRILLLVRRLGTSSLQTALGLVLTVA